MACVYVILQSVGNHLVLEAIWEYVCALVKLVRGQKVWKRSKWKLGMGVLEQKAQGVSFKHFVQRPRPFGPRRTGFLEGNFSHGPVLRGQGAGLGMILIRSEQSTSSHAQVTVGLTLLRGSLTPLLI